MNKLTLTAMTVAVLFSTAAHAACGPSISITGGITNTNSFSTDGTRSNNVHNRETNGYDPRFSNGWDRGSRDYNNIGVTLKIPLGKDYCTEKKEQDFYLQRAKVEQQEQRNRQDKIEFCSANKTLPEAALYCQEFIVNVE